MVREPFRKPLGAASDGNEVGRAASRAANGDALFGPAVVAAQPAVGAVQDEPRVAVAALDRFAAVVAQHDRCEPPAIDEQEGLLPALQPLVDGREQPLGEPGDEGPLPHVVEHDPRHSGPGGAFRELQAAAPASGGQVHGFERRGRGSEHHGDGLDGAAHEGEIARGVSEALLLLVRRIVFLVDDDHGGPQERGEYGRAGFR